MLKVSVHKLYEPVSVTFTPEEVDMMLILLDAAESYNRDAALQYGLDTTMGQGHLKLMREAQATWRRFRVILDSAPIVEVEMKEYNEIQN